MQLKKLIRLQISYENIVLNKELTLVLRSGTNYIIMKTMHQPLDKTKSDYNNSYLITNSIINRVIRQFQLHNMIITVILLVIEISIRDSHNFSAFGRTFFFLIIIAARFLDFIAPLLFEVRIRKIEVIQHAAGFLNNTSKLRLSPSLLRKLEQVAALRIISWSCRWSLVL